MSTIENKKNTKEDPQLGPYFSLVMDKKRVLNEIRLANEDIRNLKKQLRDVDKSIKEQTDKILSGKLEERQGR